MVMVFAPERLLINGTVFALPNPVYETAFAQEVQRPVDRGARSLHPRLLYLQIEGFRIEMTVKRQGLSQDDRPFFRKPLSSFFQEFAEDFLSHQLRMSLNYNSSFTGRHKSTNTFLTVYPSVTAIRRTSKERFPARFACGNDRKMLFVPVICHSGLSGIFLAVSPFIEGRHTVFRGFTFFSVLC